MTNRLHSPWLAASSAIAVAVLFASSLVFSAPAEAADTYEIDTSHSEMAFQIRHLVTKTRGHFGSFEGTVRLDRENVSESSVDFSIDASSIDTSHQQRDNHLRSEEFFAVEEFPKITFKSLSFKKAGDQVFDVRGILTMRGVSKEITLTVTFLGEAKDPWGNTRAGFETSITLNRKDYGINWNAALDQGGFILGDEVKVEVNLETIKQKKKEVKE